MSELRLVPAALAVWAAAACCILFGAWAALLVVGVLAAGCLLAREHGQAVLTAGLGAAATLTAAVRKHASVSASEIVGTVSGTPKQTESGAYLVRVKVPGQPSTTPVFADDLPDGAPAPADLTGMLAFLDRLRNAGLRPRKMGDFRHPERSARPPIIKDAS